MNHVSKIIIIIIIIKEKKSIKVKLVGGDGRERQRACRGDFLIFIIFSLCFFLRFMKIGL